ncbi:3-dehydroquinate dehydratase [Microcella alkaliphila]|uniref:3-dehydroquinate dehydratase n=1 Tax=Microcella alkaliphila TaxID=279828 RepID=A0A4Q7TZ22_9MICO|nr:type II 3-dehydroquinate dehydratase [Microcella alkaliphila]RZT66404.1 3-dehydroquinate dehydratase [Microcella alkaliphila]
MTESIRQGTRRHKIVIIDGPNMTNLGARNKKVYGAINSIEELQLFSEEFGDRIGVEVETFVSNFEGAILEYIHATATTADAFIINPAGLTEIGIPTKHALSETSKPVVEVHFANVDAPPTAPRGLPIGPWDSVFRSSVTGVAMGMRQYSYSSAILGLAMALDDETFLGADL